MILPGQIYWADFGEAGPHPVIVVSRRTFNRGQYVVVGVCTSARFEARRALPNCVPFRAGQFGLTADCVAQCENVLSAGINQLDTAGGPVGTPDDAARRDVVRAIGFVIESDCEPE